MRYLPWVYLPAKRIQDRFDYQVSGWPQLATIICSKSQVVPCLFLKSRCLGFNALILHHSWTFSSRPVCCTSCRSLTYFLCFSLYVTSKRKCIDCKVCRQGGICWQCWQLTNDLQLSKGTATALVLQPAQGWHGSSYFLCILTTYILCILTTCILCILTPNYLWVRTC